MRLKSRLVGLFFCFKSIDRTTRDHSRMDPPTRFRRLLWNNWHNPTPWNSRLIPVSATSIFRWRATPRCRTPKSLHTLVLECRSLVTDDRIRSVVRAFCCRSNARIAASENRKQGLTPNAFRSVPGATGAVHRRAAIRSVARIQWTRSQGHRRSPAGGAGHRDSGRRWPCRPASCLRGRPTSGRC